MPTLRIGVPELLKHNIWPSVVKGMWDWTLGIQMLLPHAPVPSPTVAADRHFRVKNLVLSMLLAACLAFDQSRRVFGIKQHLFPDLICLLNDES